MLLLLSADFFKINFFEKLFQDFNTVRVSNGLDPDQSGPDLGPSKLFANVSTANKQRVNLKLV